jgi:hypothetical protein
MESSDTENKSIRIKDERKNQRREFLYSSAEYVLQPDTTHEIFIGFTLNFSDSGLCLLTPKLLEEGQEIIIKSNFPPLLKKAAVRWIEKYDNVFHKVGLEFVK